MFHVKHFGRGFALAEEVWTIKAALDWTVGYLERKGDATPLVSAQWLLSEATGLSRIELYVNYERPLSMDERDVLRGFVMRRGRGEPLQYITGEVGFRHITVKVRPGVLIPRPETEVLVSEVLAALPQANRPRSAEFLAEMSGDFGQEGENVSCETSVPYGLPNADGAGHAETLPHAEMPAPPSSGVSADEGGAVELVGGFGGVEAGAIAAAEAIADAEPNAAVGEAHASGESAFSRQKLLVADICTGSGCIACSIAYEHPDACVIATDIANEALELARENVAALGLAERVQVLESDLGEGVSAELMGAFDAVVSNPPYVPTAVMAEIPHEVAAYEPSLALDGGADGLDLYRRLLPWSLRALKPGGFFACELHETCLDEAAELARAAGFSNVRIVYDLAGKPRVLTGSKPLE